jgi:hypothetical protein
MNMAIDFSSPTVILVLAAAVLALVIGIALAAQAYRRRSIRLRNRFGAEYERIVLENGSERKAHAVLIDRESRVKKLKLLELGTTQRERFLSEWDSVQSRFLDHPRSALMEADELVTQLLQARGYPASDFDQSVENISVHFPRLTEDYRFAHTVAMRSARGEATTEELRTAMIQYRSLFDELAKPGPIELRSQSAA